MALSTGSMCLAWCCDMPKGVVGNSEREFCVMQETHTNGELEIMPLMAKTQYITDWFVLDWTTFAAPFVGAMRRGVCAVLN